MTNIKYRLKIPPSENKSLVIPMEGKMAFMRRALKKPFRIGFGGLGRPTGFPSLEEALDFAKSQHEEHAQIFLYHDRMKVNLKRIMDNGLDPSEIFSEI